MGRRKIENKNGVLHRSFIIPVKNYSFFSGGAKGCFHINPIRVVLGIFFSGANNQKIKIDTI